LTQEQKARISEKLKSFAGVIFDTGWGYPNEEQQEFVGELEDAINGAGWKQVDWPGRYIPRPGRHNAGAVAAASDISIQWHPTDNALFLTAATALVAALKDEEIAAHIDRLNEANASENVMHILIGMKR
jgi:hypothetical protein